MGEIEATVESNLEKAVYKNNINMRVENENYTIPVCCIILKKIVIHPGGHLFCCPNDYKSDILILSTIINNLMVSYVRF